MLFSALAPRCRARRRSGARCCARPWTGPRRWRYTRGRCWCSRRSWRRRRRSGRRRWSRCPVEVAPDRVSCVNTPTFAGATVVASHPPAKDGTAKLWWEAHYRRDEATRVAAPRLATGDGTTSSRSDRRVIATCNETASPREDIHKLPTEVAKFQHAAVKAALQIKVMPER